MKSEILKFFDVVKKHVNKIANYNTNSFLVKFIQIFKKSHKNHSKIKYVDFKI